MKRRILLVDFYNLFIRNFQAVSLTNENGEHAGAVVGSLRSLKSIITKINPTDVYVLSDGPNSALRRKMMLKEYKGNRKKEWKKGACRAYDFLNEQEQKDNWSMQKQRVFDYLDNLPIKFMDIPYVEADDIIAEIANTKANENTQMFIYSSDADYHQLIDPNIVCFNPITKKLWTEDTFFDKHGMIPDNYIYLKTIQGDASDNVIGIKGIGAKTFMKMFPELAETKIENLDELFDLCQHAVDSKAKKHTPSTIKKFESILESKEQLRINYNVMQLSEVDISQQSRDLISNLWDRDINKFNKMQLKRMFYEDGFHSLNRQFLDWSKVFMKIALYGSKK